MKLYISKPEDRDAVLLALARNGYTVRQGREKPPGSKQAVGYVEVLEREGTG